MTYEFIIYDRDGYVTDEGGYKTYDEAEEAAIRFIDSVCDKQNKFYGSWVCTLAYTVKEVKQQ